MDRSALPRLFKAFGAGSLQGIALAQLVLMVLRLGDLPTGHRAEGVTLVLRQLCDNMGVVHATAKQLSQKKPLRWVVQPVGFHASLLGVALATSHVAGRRNIWG